MQKLLDFDYGESDDEDNRQAGVSSLPNNEQRSWPAMPSVQQHQQTTSHHFPGSL